MASKHEWVEFLQWCLPRMRFRWAGYRRVRGQVIKRVKRRMGELDLSALHDYRSHLNDTPEEWNVLESYCSITISRFYRDRDVFDSLHNNILPQCIEAAVQQCQTSFHVWSAGCASGEEAYTFKLLWHHMIRSNYPLLSLHILSTDIRDNMLQRAREASYPLGSLRELPQAWIEPNFHIAEDECTLRPGLQDNIEWLHQDIRKSQPDGPFDIIFCRNMVFTYLDQAWQQTLLQRFQERLQPWGTLVLGKHESLPTPHCNWIALDPHHRIYGLERSSL